MSDILLLVYSCICSKQKIVKEKIMNNGDNQNTQFECKNHIDPSEYNASGSPDPVVGEPVEAGETTVTKKPRNWKKIVLTAVAIILIAVILATGTSAVYTNYIGMPGILNGLGNTLEKKYSLNTVYDFSAMEKQGKLSAGVSFEEDNFAGMPEGDISLSASYKGPSAIATFHVYDETINSVSTKDELAVNIEDFNKGQYYGVSLKDFRENLEDSIFGPDSNSDYALSEEMFEFLCNVVEMTDEDNKDAKEMEKDMQIVLKYFDDIYKDSDISKAEKSYKAKEILGEKRSVRSETYTINEETVGELLDNLADGMEDAPKKVKDAAERLIEKTEDSLKTMMGMDVSWKKLTKMMKEIADEFEMGDFEIRLEVCYVKTYVSALLINVASDDLEMEANITVDFGEKPVQNVNTSIVAEVEVDGETVFDGFLKLLEEEKGKKTTYTLSGEVSVETTVDMADNRMDGVQQKNLTYAGEIVLVLDQSKKEASLSVSYSENMEDVEVFTLILGYEDSKNELKFTFEELTFGETFMDGYSVTAEDLGMDIFVSFSTKPDKIPSVKYENILDWKTRDVNNLQEELEEFLTDLAEEYKDVLPDFSDSDMPLE